MLDRDRSAGKLVCDCGGVIPRPLPPNCPHCGARIVGVRRRANWAPPLIVALLFGVLLAFLWALQRWWID